MNNKELQGIFVSGPVTPEFIAASIQKHQRKTDIGAHQLFLGQVRADQKDGMTCEGIEYSAYMDMANERMKEYREKLFHEFPITCMHVYHSLGWVEAGQISLFVFVSSPHRTACMDVCRLLVEWIKKELPVWGREQFSGMKQWKKNTSG
ncbi:MAG TPA: molybdenum cofactor biosynthesis protein MoaE [Chitinophagaceae bacterium]|nr:molybdenum cofactor biosynthesis protein MoaE [Chitinophagaceae bacterium]HNF71699.1 molybdenum cofactor biosynthesis protein MoaE [Chitinophagaceae bacterium]